MALLRSAALLLWAALLFGCAPGPSGGTSPPISSSEAQASASYWARASDGGLRFVSHRFL